LRLPIGEFDVLYPFDAPLKASILIFVSLPPEEETGVVCTTVDGNGDEADKPLSGGPNFIPHPANGLTNVVMKNGSKGGVELAYMVFERLPDRAYVRAPAKKKRVP
jgi:hypothetical protein